MNKSFYKRVEPLDACKDSSIPTREQIDLVLEMINEEENARYFFDNLQNPLWAPILEQHGYYLNTPEPIEITKGSFTIPMWPAAVYLVRVAKAVPNTVLSVIENIETNNARIQELLLDALAEIAPADAITVAEKIGSWLASPFTDFLPVKYGVLIEKWLAAGFSREAIRLIEELITPRLPKIENASPRLYGPPLIFRSDPYWINDTVQKHYLSLLNADCEGVFNAYDRQTRHYIELAKEVVGKDVESLTGFQWRLDIPFRSSSSSDSDLYDLLIDGLRDAVIMLCQKMPDRGLEKLSSYIDGDHIIFQRLGIFALRSCGQQYRALLEKVLSNRDYLENIHFHSEYKGLLKNQFGNVSIDVKQKVISWIIAGPLDIDDRTSRHASFNEREVNSDDKKNILDRWRLENLALVSESLVGETKSIFDNLFEKYGKPDIAEKPRISTSVSWGGVPSPLSAEELEKMSFDELINLMETYTEPRDSFLDPGESLAEVFRSVVQNNPSKYSEFAYRLTESKIRFVFVYDFLNGFSEAIKSEKEKITDAVLTLCESLLKENEEQSKRRSNRDEPDLLACQLEVGRLIENVVRSDDPYLSGKLLSRVREILFVLSEHPDPVAGNESHSLDPFTQSLNCVRGVAMHGLMHFLLYVDRQGKQIEKKEIHQPNIEPDIQNILQNKLNKAKEPSLAVHSVFGAYLPQLQYLHREWVKRNIEKIFPESEDQSKYWQAAWDAYIFTSNVYGDIFRLLMRHYQRALQLLSVPVVDKNMSSSPSQRLAQHIMFLYLNELTDFGHENKLLDLFFANAPDQLRASAVFWLSKVLENQKPSNKDMLWIRLWHLWQVRVEFALVANNLNDYSKEISDYMRWLPHVPVDLGFLSEVLQRSILYLQDGFHVRLIVSFAAKHCEKYPAESVRLISDAIRFAKEPWWGPEEKDEETILKNALASGNSNARGIAIELINFRGEQGDFRWKSLLSQFR